MKPIDEKSKLVLVVLAAGLLFGFLIGDNHGFERGLKMMRMTQCDIDTAREVDRLLAPTGQDVR